MQQEASGPNEKIQQILLKSQGLLENGQYYEYEQKILTFGFRFINQNQKDQAIILYFQASKQLLKLNQTMSGFNLANKIIELQDSLDQNQIAEFLSIYSVAQFSKQKIQMINKVLKKYPESKDQICIQVGVDLINQEKYHLAWRYLIQTSDFNAENTLLKKWNSTLIEQEKEYNIIRYLLIKLGLGMFDQCEKLLLHLMPTTVTLPSLFMHLLIKTIKLQSRQAYDNLFIKFKAVLEQDSTLIDLYYRVGVQYFGLKEKNQQQNSGLGGMLSQFFQ